MLESIDSLEHPSPEHIAIAEVLTTLIEAYESQHALETPTGLAVLRELMLANDLRQKDLETVVGSRGMVSDILNERRPISNGVARKLAIRFNVPYTLFL